MAIPYPIIPNSHLNEEDGTFTCNWSNGFGGIESLVFNVGQNGISQEIVDTIMGFEHREELQRDYDRHYLDKKVEWNAKNEPDKDSSTALLDKERAHDGDLIDQLLGDCVSSKEAEVMRNLIFSDLSEDQRNLVFDFYGGGIPMAEIARQMNIDEQAIYSRMARIKRKLKKHFEDAMREKAQ